MRPLCVFEPLVKVNWLPLIVNVASPLKLISGALTVPVYVPERSVCVAASDCVVDAAAVVAPADEPRRVRRRLRRPPLMFMLPPAVFMLPLMSPVALPFMLCMSPPLMFEFMFDVLRLRLRRPPRRPPRELFMLPDMFEFCASPLAFELFAFCRSCARTVAATTSAAHAAAHTTPAANLFKS